MSAPEGPGEGCRRSVTGTSLPSEAAVRILRGVLFHGHCCVAFRGPAAPPPAPRSGCSSMFCFAAVGTLCTRSRRRVCFRARQRFSGSKPAGKRVVCTAVCPWALAPVVRVPETPVVSTRLPAVCQRLQLPTSPVASASPPRGLSAHCRACPLSCSCFIYCVHAIHSEVPAKVVRSSKANWLPRLTGSLGSRPMVLSGLWFVSGRVLPQTWCGQQGLGVNRRTEQPHLLSVTATHGSRAAPGCRPRPAPRQTQDMQVKSTWHPARPQDAGLADKAEQRGSACYCVCALKDKATSFFPSLNIPPGILQLLSSSYLKG